VRAAISRLTVSNLNGLYNLSFQPVGGQDLALAMRVAPPGRTLSLSMDASIWIDAAGRSAPISNQVQLSVHLDQLALAAAAKLYIDEYAIRTLQVENMFKLSCWLATLRTTGGTYLTALNATLAALHFNLTCVECTSPSLNYMAGTSSDPRASEPLRRGLLSLLQNAATVLSSPAMSAEIDKLIASAASSCPTPRASSGAPPTNGAISGAASMTAPESASTAQKVTTLLLYTFALLSCCVGACVFCALKQAKKRQRELEKANEKAHAACDTLEASAEAAEPSPTDLVVATESLPLSPSGKLSPAQWPAAPGSVPNERPLLHDGINSEAFRFGVPFMLLVCTGLFFSGHVAMGASVDVVVSIFGEAFALPNVFVFSMAESVVQMWDAGAVELAMIVVLFSGAWPYTKMLTMLALWLLPPGRVSPETRGSIFAWFDTLGKWSMIDIFVTVLSLVAFRISASSLPLPVQNGTDASLLPDDVGSLFSANVYVTMQWGLYANLIAQLLSQFATHAAVYAHVKAQRLPPPSIVGRELQVASMPLLDVATGQYCVPRKSSQLLVLVMAAFGAVFALVGASVPAFTITNRGLAGVFLEYGTYEATTSISYSIWDIVRLIGQQGDDSRDGGPGGIGGWLGVYLLVSVFVLCALLVPVLQCVLLGVMWWGRVSVDRLRQLLVANEVACSWQYLEVYLIAIMLSTLQISMLSRFMVYEYCEFLLPAFDSLVRLGLIEQPDAECFYIVGNLEGGSALLLCAAVLLNVVNQIACRRARACVAALETDGASSDEPPSDGIQKRRLWLGVVAAQCWRRPVDEASDGARASLVTPPNDTKDDEMDGEDAGAAGERRLAPDSMRPHVASQRGSLAGPRGSLASQRASVALKRGSLASPETNVGMSAQI